jgi:predicted kinase
MAPEISATEPCQTRLVLIVVAGLPAAGKTTLATDLGRALRCAVVGVDPVEAAIWRAGIAPGPETHDAAYLVAEALAADQLALGLHVIVDAVNGPEEARARWRVLAARTGSDLRFIMVECGDEALYRQRVQGRRRRIEGFPEPTWEGIVQRRAAFPPWTDGRLTIDSAESRHANLQRALRYLRAG